MPLHDWRRVDANVFSAFHGRMVTFLTVALNDGILPPGYYADGEQIAQDPRIPGSRIVPDVIALRPDRQLFDPAADPEPGVAVADTPPATRRRLGVPIVTPPRRHVVVRYKTGHRVVALIEIVSPANKDRPASVADLAGKVAAALTGGVHAMVLDLFPPGRHDPHGIHEAITQQFNGDQYDPPPDEPLTFVSYSAGPDVEAFIEHRAFGRDLPAMPLFLRPDRYVNVPLDPVYQSAYAGTPYVWRDVLDPSAADRPQE